MSLYVLMCKYLIFTSLLTTCALKQYTLLHVGGLQHGQSKGVIVSCALWPRNPGKNMPQYPCESTHNSSEKLVCKVIYIPDNAMANEFHSSAATQRDPLFHLTIHQPSPFLQYPTFFLLCRQKAASSLLGTDMNLQHQESNLLSVRQGGRQPCM